jgi:hypothetical protein
VLPTNHRSRIVYSCRVERSYEHSYVYKQSRELLTPNAKQPHAVSIARCLASVTIAIRMPKRSSKLRSAMENLGGWAKKRKVSADADKENKVNIGLT